MCGSFGNSESRPPACELLAGFVPWNYLFGESKHDEQNESVPTSRAGKKLGIVVAPGDTSSGPTASLRAARMHVIACGAHEGARCPDRRVAQFQRVRACAVKDAMLLMNEVAALECHLMDTQDTRARQASGVCTSPQVSRPLPIYMEGELTPSKTGLRIGGRLMACSSEGLACIRGRLSNVIARPSAAERYSASIIRTSA